MIDVQEWVISHLGVEARLNLYLIIKFYLYFSSLSY